MSKEYEELRRKMQEEECKNDKSSGMCEKLKMELEMNAVKLTEMEKREKSE